MPGKRRPKPPATRCPECGVLVHGQCRECAAREATTARPYQSVEDADIELELSPELDERRRQLLAARSAVKRANIANFQPRHVPLGRLVCRPTAFRRMLNERRV